MENKIDFIVMWVDGSDPEWQAEKAKYQISNPNTDNRVIRYRDWETLRYWFRAVEKFAPWVNKVHFVTWGHTPSWLNTGHPKLNVVKHSDFIPEKYLPTFSANPIELNVHRIKDLSDQFVLFNDDIFLIRDVKPDDFFKGGLPRDAACLNVHISYRKNNGHIEAANMDIINDHFNKNTVLKKNFFKWFNLRYGSGLVRTLCLLPWKEFPGILNAHLANSYNKSTFETVWKEEYAVLDETCSRKFRFALDVNQWLMQDWQIASGNFVPRSTRFGRNLALYDDDRVNARVYQSIRSRKYKVICVNDMVLGNDFDRIRDELKSAFDSILSGKSKFEK